MNQVTRKHVVDTVPETPVNPFVEALKTALKKGVNKGCLQKEDADNVWSVTRHPIRKSVKGRVDLDLLKQLEAWAETEFAKTQQTGGIEDVPVLIDLWEDAEEQEWLCNNLPRFYKECERLMIEYPLIA